ncbi:hypothetical protein [Xenorhabdus poinarii]|uniref:hypothetical protein n=1 Tax=Xenorhabdus poinarii TaxID=40577 RepID=UPI0005FA47B8|nr:hypothetical protein [Xenorhabdus poinarii]
MNRRKIAACLLTLIVGTGVTTYVHAYTAEHFFAGKAKELTLIACNAIPDTNIFLKATKAACL